MSTLTQRVLVASVVALLASPAAADDLEGTRGGPDASIGETNDPSRFDTSGMRDRRHVRNLITVSPGVEWFGSSGFVVRPEALYHRMLPHRLALRVGASVGGGNGETLLVSESLDGTLRSELLDSTSMSAGLRLGVDWYPVGNGMHGAFFGPRVWYDRGWVDYVGPRSGNLESSYDMTAVRIAAGWRWVWSSGLTFGLAVEGGYHDTTERMRRIDGDTRATFRDQELRGSGEMTLGWAF